MRLTTSYTIPLLGLTATTFILQHGSSALFYNGVCAFTTTSQQQLSSYRSKGPIANRHIFAVNDDDDGHQLLVQPDADDNDDNNEKQREETTAIGRRWRIASILGGIATSQLHVTKVCKLYTYNMKSL